MLRVVLEADSFEFHGSRKGLRRDCERYTALAIRRWIVVRFAWEHVMFEQDYVRELVDTAKQFPKLSIGVCTRSHVICSTRVRTGSGSDCRDFEPLLFDAWKRHPRLRTVVADAGYDSEANHTIARQDMGVQSLIKTGAGRPSKRPPTGYYRRLMSKQLRGSQRGKKYGQRAQVETVNSMLKRNLGDAMRAKTPRARRNEQLLRVLAHNIALLCDEIED